MIYDFICRDCGSSMSLEKSIREYATEGFTADELTCDCGSVMQRKLSAPAKVVVGTRKGEYNSTTDLKPTRA